MVRSAQSIGDRLNRKVVGRISDEETCSYELTRCAYDYYCGCAGAVAGGGVAVGAVGVEAGSKYQIMSSARTTAAAMMSNLFVSMGSTHCSLLPHHVSAAWRSGTSQTS